VLEHKLFTDENVVYLEGVEPKIEVGVSRLKNDGKGRPVEKKVKVKEFKHRSRAFNYWNRLADMHLRAKKNKKNKKKTVLI
jgi:hypothetical protein